MLMPMMQCRWWEMQMEDSGKLPSLAIARAPNDPYAGPPPLHVEPHRDAPHSPPHRFTTQFKKGCTTRPLFFPRSDRARPSTIPPLPLVQPLRWRAIGAVKIRAAVTVRSPPR
jgi:hypothetical protein